MRNIPTDLLRTVIAVVDLRSFTKAAHSLGVTQPAVSAQVKRLQSLLGCELLDKSAPGVSLTPTGEQVVGEARRLLAINDRIFDLAAPVHEPQTLRFGMPGDFVSPALWYKLGHFRARWPDVRLHMRSGSNEDLRRALLQGDLDLAVAVSDAAPHEDARHHWHEDIVWVRGALTVLDPAAPVPLVTRGGACVFHRRMVAALEAAGRSYNVVFTASRINDLRFAVVAGLGVTALARALATTEAVAWDDGALPKLDGIVCNVCVRDEAATPALEELADALVSVLHSPAREEPIGGGAIEGPDPGEQAGGLRASR